MFGIFYSETNVGRKRENNEDYMLTYSPRFGVDMYMVLDGIGGANSGEVASKTAAEKTVEYYKDHMEDMKDIPEVLKMAVKYANRCVYEMNKQNKTEKIYTAIWTVWKKNVLMLIKNFHVTKRQLC